MFGSDNFQIVYGETRHMGELTVTGALPKGTAVDDSGDNDMAVLANGNAVGFITKNVTLAGPTYEQMSLNFRDLPETSGNKMTVEDVEIGGQVEVENEPSKAYNASTGAMLMVTTGTGDLTSAAKDVDVSFKNGRFYAAQTGDRVWGRVLNSAVTPIVAGNIRVRIERVAGEVL